MNTQQLAEEIYQYVNEHDHVSFAELQTRWRDDVEVKGDLAVELSAGKNIFAWFGMSQIMFDAVSSLVNSGRIVLSPSAVLVYMVDGIVPRFPIAGKSRRPPSQGYKKPHWAPVVLRPKEKVEAKQAKKKVSA